MDKNTVYKGLRIEYASGVALIEYSLWAKANIRITKAP